MRGKSRGIVKGGIEGTFAGEFFEAEMAAASRVVEPVTDFPEEGLDLVSVLGEDVLIVADAITGEADRPSLAIAGKDREGGFAPAQFEEKRTDAAVRIGPIPGEIPGVGLERGGGGGGEETPRFLETVEGVDGLMREKRQVFVGGWR